jgi:hypothetical protein
MLVLVDNLTYFFVIIGFFILFNILTVIATQLNYLIKFIKYQSPHILFQSLSDLSIYFDLNSLQ